ncbi:LacI family DNA-binding transcriptional regulator [Balneolales bacterium ANBcel1]|nr:LacI family DNA-binding transcriptional regulator [Balneolales bacterium ANBcel1]
MADGIFAIELFLDHVQPRKGYRYGTSRHHTFRFMKKKATLNDIAKILGLTKVSVSKALRNHPDISEATKKKVKKVAEQIGYRPNLIARSLTSSRSRTLGVVVPKIAHNFFAHVVAGIQKSAASHEYEIVLTVSDENEELERKHIEALMSMQVDGLLVSVSMDTRNLEVYEWLRDMQIPLVFFDRHIPDLGFNSVIIDDMNAARLGVSKLIEYGCRKIAHLSGYDHISIGRNRRMGYEKALVDHGLTVNPEFITQGGFGEEAGYKGFKELYERGGDIDGLFSVTFPVALGAYIAMRELDPTIIDRLKMLAFGDSGIRNIVPFPQYYIHQPAETMGERAADMLIREIAGEVQAENRLDIMETEFLVSGNDFPLEWKTRQGIETG